MTTEPDRWNHNIHYHPLILAAVPDGCGRALDVAPADLPAEIGGAMAHRILMATRTYWEHSAPKIWPPPETYQAMRRIARRELPGVRYRRHLLWRYSLIWTKPHSLIWTKPRVS